MPLKLPHKHVDDDDDGNNNDNNDAESDADADTHADNMFAATRFLKKTSKHRGSFYYIFDLGSRNSFALGILTIMYYLIGILQIIMSFI